MLRMRLGVLAISAVALVQIASAEPALRVLFIGNSFTVQSIPDVFKRLAMDAGWQPPVVTNAAVVSQTLEWHRSNAPTLAAVDQGNWDYVVLQEYSTRPTDNPAVINANPLKFKEDVTWFYDRIKATSPNAQIILFETWARHENNNYYPTYYANRDTMQAQLNYHYHDAAENYIPANATYPVKTDVALAPVGEAWAINYHGENRMLHATDLYHAGSTGQYLTAMVIYSTIYERSVEGLGAQLGLMWNQTGYLQMISDATTGQTLSGGPDGPKGRGVFMGSFEKPAIAADSGFTNRECSGWTVNSNTTNGLSVRNSANDLFANTSFLSGVDREIPAPGEGLQFLWVNTGEVSQQLVDTLLPNTEYTLRVAVGRILRSTYYDVDYYIKLYAGDTELESIISDTSNLALGAFTDHVIHFKTDSQVAPGQPLRVFLGRSGPNIASKLAFDNVRLEVRIDGDYNQDGSVDLADYTIWADNYGQAGANVPGDGNGDGVVDLADYTIWADNYGNGYVN